MPIELDDNGPSGPRIPVLRRQRIGDTFVGALVKQPVMRDALKDGKPVLNDRGKPRQELVITLMAMPGTTMAAGIGQDPPTIATPGTVVRTILRGGGFSAYIDAKASLGGKHNVGDVFTLTTTHGQAYDANGKATGGQLTTQEQCDQVPRQQALGYYGDLTIRRATAEDTQWVQLAEAEYLAQTAVTLPDAEPAASGDLVGF